MVLNGRFRLTANAIQISSIMTRIVLTSRDSLILKTVSNNCPVEYGGSQGSFSQNGFGVVVTDNKATTSYSVARIARPIAIPKNRSWTTTALGNCRAAAARSRRRARPVGRSPAAATSTSILTLNKRCPEASGTFKTSGSGFDSYQYSRQGYNLLVNGVWQGVSGSGGQN